MVRLIVLHFTLVLVLLLSKGAIASDVKAEEQEAVSILTTACDFLAKTYKFTMSVELNYDVVQESGQKIEFGGRQDIKIYRPEHARIDMLRRDGSHDTIIYNGQKVILYNQDENVYAEEAFTGGLDEAFEFIADELEIPLPLGELLSTHAADILTEKIESGKVIGDSVVDTVPTTHLAFQNGTVDFQIWVGDGRKPLPQRLVIHYKNEPGQPKFIAQFLYWNTTPELSKENFSFTQPEGAERIPIAVVDLAEGEEGGKP